MRIIASVAGAGLLFVAASAKAVDLGDLDVTIRVIESSDRDPSAITSEIALPDLPKEVSIRERSRPAGDARSALESETLEHQSGSRDAKTGDDEASHTRESAVEEQHSTSKEDVKQETETYEERHRDREGRREGSTESRDD